MARGGGGERRRRRRRRGEEGGEGEEEIFYSNCQNKVYKYKTKVHEIIKQTWNPFTENFGRTSYY